MTTAQRPAIFPPGIDGGALLSPTRHSAWTLPGPAGAQYRRAVTAPSPLLFGVTYLGAHMRDQVSGNMSFAQLHLDLCASARRWVAPHRYRDVWVAPRRAGKSAWLFLALPLWALAHGHREFLLGFSLTAPQAQGQLANLRAELAENELLLADFPELRPRRGAGARDTAGKVTLAGGASIMARGLDESTLGTRIRTTRPDLIIGDDLEPEPANHSLGKRDKILSQLTSGILPMGAGHAVVQLTGTTTMHGSLIHQAVQAAAGERVAGWIGAHEFRPRHYPPVVGEGAGRASFWPQGWPLAELDRMAELAPQDYALNFQNRPEQAGALGYWTRELIRYNPRRDIVRRILYADVAMTQNARSDQTAIVQVGVSADGRHAVVEHAELGRITGLELRERMWAITAAHPRTLREWWVETNQGGDRWREILSPLPPGVALHTEHVGGSKRSRIELALSHYQRGAVEHRGPVPALEEQMLAWTPAATSDDGLDALAGALRRAFPTVA